jgi:hypothetical protein
MSLVSDDIRAMPLLWIEVNDAASSGSDRALIERKCIGF